MDIDGKPDFMISVTDFPSLMDIDEEFDGIFHLAATTSPPQFESDPLGGFHVNANGTLNILEYAKRKKIRRVVIASSSATYGNSESISREEIIPQTYSNLYPITKVIDEYLARYYTVRKEVECIRSDSLTHMALERTARHSMPVSYGDSSQTCRMAKPP